MHDDISLFTCKSPDQATHKVGCPPGDFIMVTFIFLQGLCGCVWVFRIMIGDRTDTTVRALSNEILQL